MNKRITEAFAKGKAFIPFVTCGDPSLDVTEKIVYAMEEAGADLITLHAEATKHLHRAIQQVKAKGLKVGVALNPATPLSALDYVLEELDMVLIMTVNPGYGGQSYIAKMDDKIKELRAIINEKGLDIDIEVDGGISAKNVAHVKECGANVFVAGSAVFNGDIASSAKDILEAMEA